MDATTAPHAPPLFKKQLEAIRASNARGTVEEFHDLLSSLSDEISEISRHPVDPKGSSCPRKAPENHRRNRAFVSLCAAVLSAQTRDRAAIRGIQQLAEGLGIQRGEAEDLDFSPEAIALAPPGKVEECLKGVQLGTFRQFTKKCPSFLGCVCKPFFFGGL